MGAAWEPADIRQGVRRLCRQGTLALSRARNYLDLPRRLQGRQHAAQLAAHGPAGRRFGAAGCGRRCRSSVGSFPAAISLSITILTASSACLPLKPRTCMISNRKDVKDNGRF